MSSAYQYCSNDQTYLTCLKNNPNAPQNCQVLWSNCMAGQGALSQTQTSQVVANAPAYAPYQNKYNLDDSSSLSQLLSSGYQNTDYAANQQSGAAQAPFQGTMQSLYGGYWWNPEAVGSRHGYRGF